MKISPLNYDRYHSWIKYITRAPEGGRGGSVFCPAEKFRKAAYSIKLPCQKTVKYVYEIKFKHLLYVEWNAIVFKRGLGKNFNTGKRERVEGREGKRREKQGLNKASHVWKEPLQQEHCTKYGAEIKESEDYRLIFLLFFSGVLISAKTKQ